MNLFSGDPDDPKRPLLDFIMPGGDKPDQQNAVSLKLPTFWASQPQVWFEQAEAQFHIRQITADDTKYYYVISALDQDTTGASSITFASHQPKTST